MLKGLIKKNMGVAGGLAANAKDAAATVDQQ